MGVGEGGGVQAVEGSAAGWHDAMRDLAAAAADAAGRMPDPEVLRTVRLHLEAATRAERDFAEDCHLQAEAGWLAAAGARLAQALAPFCPEPPPDPLPGLHQVGASGRDQVRAAAALLQDGEAHAAEAGRLHGLAVALMQSGRISALDEATALRDAMQHSARQGLQCLREARAPRAAPEAGETVVIPARAPTPAPASDPAPSPASAHAAAALDQTVVPPAVGTLPLAPRAQAPAAAGTAMSDGISQTHAGLGRVLDRSFDFSRERLIVAGRYDVEDLIGAGSFGTVLEAHDRVLERLVALKVMRLPAARDDDDAMLHARFRQEAQAVARLSHSCIVPVYDYGEGGGFAWIVMELVIGETLKGVLDRGDAVSPAEAVRVATELLQALGFAHGRGVVHRDVKPANVLLAMDGGAGLGGVRLVDFGVARFGDSGLTVAGQLVGTVMTMSPEQVRGEEADARADLWAVGVILYRMVTGRLPFQGDTGAVLAGILTQQPVPPSECPPRYCRGFDAVLARALAKPVAHRFATAEEFIAALAGIPTHP